MKSKRLWMQVRRPVCARPARTNHLWLPIAVGVAGLLMAAALHAAPRCTIRSTAVNFGNYNPLSAASVTGTGALTFQCQSGVTGGGITYTISLSSGSGTYVQRTLTSGGNVLNYNLYTDATLATVWGNGSSGSTTVSTTISRAQALAGAINTVYGNIPAQQDVIPGSYTDTITVTVTF